jgi:hypothetical protein
MDRVLILDWAESCSLLGNELVNEAVKTHREKGEGGKWKSFNGRMDTKVQ